MRNLNTKTLDGAIRDYAGQFLLPSQFSKRNPKIAIVGRDWVMQSMHNFTFKDEFDYVLQGMKGYLGQEAYKEFQEAAKDVFTPRDDDVLAHELETRLAIRPDGSAIKGKLGTTVIGSRITGRYVKTITVRKGTDREQVYEVLKNIKEPVFAGDPNWQQSVGALVPNISAEIAIVMADAFADHFDSDGTGNPVLQGRTGTQPVDPDAATTGTNLFTLALTDANAFGAAADQADGTVDVAAGTIADDTSADATGTLGYCRLSSSNDGATPLDDHLDGEAGTSGANYNFNTLSIVSGSTVSVTSLVVTVPQGSTAT